MSDHTQDAATIDLLFRLADDELMMGHRNAEWTGVGPVLEEDIAFSSMAQDELGHAFAYYTVLHEHLGQDNPDTLAFRREAADFRNARLTALPRSDWAAAVMRQFLYDAAEQVRLEHYSSHPFAPLAQLARKFRGEEKYHLMHGKSWVMRLGSATEDSRARLQAALEALWPHALGLFEPGQGGEDAGASEAALCAGWLAQVCPLLVSSSLQVPAERTAKGQWQSRVAAVYGRYAEPAPERVALLDAMQKVYRLDPNADW
ncbi:MAG: phenylacetate-CoA oxygenase subunit PaaC [Chloroflexi bacterium]|nr:phenylacetate-CoA oxygenase subunit PaaC [Chloroflexota bacterium]